MKNIIIYTLIITITFISSQDAIKELEKPVESFDNILNKDEKVNETNITENKNIANVKEENPLIEPLKSIEEVKPAEVIKSNEEVKPIETVNTTEEVKPVEEVKQIESSEAKTTEEVKPVIANESKSTEDAKQIDEVKTTETKTEVISDKPKEVVAKLPNIKDQRELDEALSSHSFLSFLFCSGLVFIVFLIYDQSKKYDFLNHDLDTECGYELLETA